MCAKKKYGTGEYLRYLRNELPERDRHDLERHLEADPFDKEAMEGMEKLDPDLLEADLLELHAGLQKRLGRRRRRNWYGIAATAASILIVGTVFLNIYDVDTTATRDQDLSGESFRDPDRESPAEAEKPALNQTETGPGEAGHSDALPQETPKEEIKETAVMEMQAFEEEGIADDAIVVKDAVVVDEAAVVEKTGPDIVAVEAVPTKKESQKMVEKRKKMASIPAVPASETAAIREPGGTLAGVLVSSEDNEPIPGASVMIRGTSSGTVTDTEGRFSLPAEDSQTTVVASFIGMETKEYRMEEHTENLLVMEPDRTSLDEVVVVGYGSAGSVSGVESGAAYTMDLEKEGQDYSRALPSEGYSAFKQYMGEYMIFPEGHQEGQKEIVVLTFKVEASGMIRDIEAIRSPGPDYSREAIRLLEQGPPWIPATRNGTPVEERVRIRIVFNR